MSPTKTADETLLRHLRAGKHSAFERLYRDYHGPIYNVCARMLGSREEAEDVTQEVFIKAFRKLPGEEVHALRPWLFKVATNVCLNQLRVRRGGADAEPITEIPAKVDAFHQAQTVAYVEQTLAQLNDRYRAALVLKDLQGLASQEIGDVLEVSPGTADVLVHRARAAFKRTFAKVAGETPAPADLGLVLAPLAVPGALQAMPHLVHLALPTGGALAKLTAALTSKVAIGAAAAGLLIGGGVALDRLVVQPPHHSARASVAAPGKSATIPVRYISDHAHDGAAPLERWAGHGCPSGEASCAPDHTASHDATEHAGSTHGTAEHTSATAARRATWPPASRPQRRPTTHR
jgi:RNA polymerase sigma-70 factor (ECF subfamily)